MSITIAVTSAIKTVDGGTPTHNPAAVALGVLSDPVGSALGAALGAAAHVPLVHVVAARVVEVETF